MEPIVLQTCAQREPRAVKDDVDIGDRQAEFRADFARLQLDDFAHQEDPALLGWQAIQAGIEYR